MPPLPIGYQTSASAYGLFVDHDMNNVIDAREFAELPAAEMGRLLADRTRWDSVPLDHQDHALKLSMPAAATMVGSLSDRQLVDLLAADPFAGLPQGNAQRVEFAAALRAEIGEERFRQAVFSLGQAGNSLSPAESVWKHALDDANRLSAENPVSLSKAPTLNESSKLSVGEAFSQAIDNNQIVMIGERHGVWDESVFTPMLAQAKAQGVKYVALEIPSNLQGALDTYVRTGRNEFPHDQQDFGRRAIPNLEFARAAHRAGLQVVAVDKPERELTNELAQENLLTPYMAWKAHSSYIDTAALRGVQLRDEYIANKLGGLAEGGKTIALLGKAHTFVDSQPAQTARTLLQQRGVPVAAMQLELPDQSPVIDQAYANVFGNQAPEASFAYPAAGLQGLGRDDLTTEVPHGSGKATIPYARTPRDYVVFLSAEFHRPNAAFRR